VNNKDKSSTPPAEPTPEVTTESTDTVAEFEAVAEVPNRNGVVKDANYWLERDAKAKAAQARWRAKPENKDKMKEANKRWREKPENQAKLKETRTAYNKKRNAEFKAAKAALREQGLLP
jgi:hypothetical protein